MAALRLLLPPLRTLVEESVVSYAVTNKKGDWPKHYDRRPLSELAQHAAGARIEAFLHPSDLTLTTVWLPPLPAAKMRVAVVGLADPLILGDPDSVIIAHGRRDDEGNLTIAWVDRAVAEAAQEICRRCGVTLRSLIPSPFFLPITVAGWTAWEIDGYAVVRIDADRGFIQPVPVEPLNTSDVLSAGSTSFIARVMQATPSTITWVGKNLPSWWPANSAIASSVIAPEQCWAVLPPSWTLPLLNSGDRGAAPNWSRPLLYCAAAALAWLVGLNLYAARLQHAGETLEQQLNRRVQDVFPALAIVVDPLRQARQQRDARRAAMADGADAELAFLLQGARKHMAFAAGQVQTIRYEAGALELELVRGASNGEPASTTPVAVSTSSGRPGPGASGSAAAASKPSARPGWFDAAQKEGIEVEVTDTGWRLRRLENSLVPGPGTAGTGRS